MTPTDPARLPLASTAWRRGLLALVLATLTLLILLTAALPAGAKPKHSDCDAEAAEETNCVYDPQHKGGADKDRGRGAARSRAAASTPTVPARKPATVPARETPAGQPPAKTK